MTKHSMSFTHPNRSRGVASLASRVSEIWRARCPLFRGMRNSTERKEFDLSFFEASPHPSWAFFSLLRYVNKFSKTFSLRQNGRILSKIHSIFQYYCCTSISACFTSRYLCRPSANVPRRRSSCLLHVGKANSFSTTVACN